MMNKVDEMYPNIEWIRNKEGEIKKENYDACDSLVCALAYININRHGVEEPKIISTIVEQNSDGGVSINYQMEMWGTVYDKTLILSKS